jgi:S1-C subfamily serine protease
MDNTMKKFLMTTLMFLSMALFSFGSTSNQNVDKERDFINNQFFPATALLYSQNAEGGMNMRCTTTAIAKNDNTYIFVTAAHCGCEDDTVRRTVSPQANVDFYITSDNPDEKDFQKAKVTGCGYRHSGDDFMLLSVTTDRIYTVVPLGNDPKLMDSVINVASPLGLGKQVFTGIVSSPILDRPVIEEDINWQGVVMLQMFGVNGGSSGSAVVCVDQHAICAFVVGSIGNTSMTAMPVSRLKALIKGLSDGTYKHWVPNADTVTNISPAVTTPKK